MYVYISSNMLKILFTYVARNNEKTITRKQKVYYMLYVMVYDVCSVICNLESINN